MNFRRLLEIESLLAKKSVFLWGPRATGKSYLVRQQLGDTALVIDLLRSDLFLRLSADPSQLEPLISARKPQQRYVVIDEVQKIPLILDEVHRLIESKHIHFLLTGSSARKLKRGQANLLAGRAWTASLHPLAYPEFPSFDLMRQLRWGGLPSVVQSDAPDEELHAYVGTYLQEEIQAEGFVRRLPQFSRFLQMAALTNGQTLNFANIASDTGVPAATVREYYFLLEDTLVGFMLAPWTGSKKRKAISSAKFYFFDTGVTHTLAGSNVLDRNSDLYGRSLEHWIAMELRAYLSYTRSHDTLGFWRSTRQHEVDFTVGNDVAIEVKATRKVTRKDMRGLKALNEENVFKKLLMVSEDPIEAKYDNMHCMPWNTFIESLWSNQLF